jgi:hypothetical protein
MSRAFQILRELFGDSAEEAYNRLKAEDLLKDGVSFGNADINTVIDSFKEHFGVTKATRYDRFAAKRLIQRHGAEAICDTIRKLSQGQTDKFAPTVNSVSELENKWVSVNRFVNKEIEEVW